MNDTAAQVTIYGAEWCPPCHMAKNYLKSQNIPYNYINIDENREAGMEIAKKTGWNAIPIIEIGSDYLLGFDRPKLDATLQKHNVSKA